MNKELEYANDLLNFINESQTSFHAVDKVSSILENNGYIKLEEEKRWNIKPGYKYYVTKNDSALIAFSVPNTEIYKYGFKIIGAHTDCPCFRIKPNPEIKVENSYLKLNTEVYGGPILNTWLDRPLSIAGRVSLKSDDILRPINKLVNIKRPIAIIPNLAIHMNRQVNKGVELNRQKDILPIIATINNKFNEDEYLINLLCEELKIQKEDILDFDLFLYECEKGVIMGANNEFISSSRLDDLELVHSALTAMVKSSSKSGCNILALFDNEEVGSGTKQGADSPFLKSVLERIIYSMGMDKEDYFRALSRSFLISADSAHGVHPNFLEKVDPTNRPVINKGPVIKISAAHKYTSDSDSSSVYEEICKNAKVPYQKFVNRSDEIGGSTIGPISSSHINIRSVDIGNPLLAMHSIRELAGVLDHTYAKQSFEYFYNL
ncbi:MAG: M18 family aminopeptidase [Clostridiaceae bacterium]